MPVASVVWPEGAMSASAGPSEGTSRAARPSPRRSCSSGCATMALQGSELGTIGPDGRSGHEQARVVHRLERELDPPFVDAFGPALRTTAVRFCSTSSSASPWRSSSSPTGGTIRKQVRTGSASVVAVACQASRFPASTASSSSSASTVPSGETRAASHASTGALVLARRRRSVGWRSRGEPAGQCIREAPHERAECIARCLRLPNVASEILAPDGRARGQERCGKRPNESLDPTSVGTVDQRTPPGPPSVGCAFERREDSPPRGQFHDHLRRPGGEPEVGGKRDTGHVSGRQPDGVASDGHQPGEYVRGFRPLDDQSPGPSTRVARVRPRVRTMGRWVGPRATESRPALLPRRATGA